MSASSQMFGRSVGLFGGITGAMSALSCIALLLTVGSAAAQQCDWLPGHGVAGTAGQVNAIVTWDPDGAGPASEVLVVGGQLTAAATHHRRRRGLGRQRLASPGICGRRWGYRGERAGRV